MLVEIEEACHPDPELRQNLSLSSSRDSGGTWRHDRVVDAGPSSYSVMTAQGSQLALLFERCDSRDSDRGPAPWHQVK